MRAVNAPSQFVRAKPVPSPTCSSTTLSAASARTPSSSGKRGWPGGGATFGAGALTVSGAYGGSPSRLGDHEHDRHEGEHDTADREHRHRAERQATVPARAQRVLEVALALGADEQ